MRIKTSISMLVVLVLLIALGINTANADVGGVAQTGNNTFNSWTPTGNPAADMAACAMAQVGRTKSSLGYYGGWCAAFVVDCAYLTGQSNAVPFISGATHNEEQLKKYIINRGGVEVSKSQIQAGDIIFWSGHAAIAVDNVHSVHGNTGNTVNYLCSWGYGCDNKGTHGFSGGSFQIALRPNYKSLIVKPSSITLNTSSEVLEINQQLTLTAEISPSNASDKKINWSSSNTGVATVSNGVVRAVGEGSAVITASANADSSIKKTCTITVVKQAEESCDWAEKSYLPPNVNSDGWEIEVKNHYSQVSTSSPGTGWTQTGSSTRYVVSGEPYTTYKDLGETSTRKFVENVWYHWCGYAGHSDWVELENAPGYWQYHENAIGTGLEDRAQYEDSNIKGVYQHELWWTAGQYAGHLANCGLGGQRWYYGWKYQNYTAVTENTWTRDSEWLSLDQADGNATSISYRFRLKGCDAVSYTVTFKVANGSWDDGTTADKKVTLEGIASDTLTLTEEQIPTAGTKPAANYKTGEWGVTPSASTRITADTTYTYSYQIKNAVSSTVIFKVVNGSWDDETTADKTVTLNGYEGDTLKLTAAQIPAVGTKPEANFKAGSWDTTPSVDTAILGNKTFTYTYAAKNNITRTVTFKVVNGSWDDGTTADKTVTLTGYEGDSLKLTQSQIPAVGSKPNETYKAGSWDTTPVTTTAITSNKTYTYTYATDESDTRVKLIVSSERARPGEEVTLGVSIENNPGFSYLKMEVNYDSTALEYLGYEGTGLTGWIGSNLAMSWLDVQNECTINDELLSLKFKVSETASEGDVSVTVICHDDEMNNVDEEDIAHVIQPGKIIVYKIISGDINGDGIVNGKDLIRLQKYLVGMDVQIVGNGDVNGDNSVNGKDLIRLQKFLVGMDVQIY